MKTWLKILILINPFPKNRLGQNFDFTLKLVDNSTFDTREHRGKLILLDFWSWYCVPCRPEIQNLDKLSKKHADKLIIQPQRTIYL